MEKIKTIIDRKQSHFNKISPVSSISDALGRMSSRRMDCLIVMDEDENFLGLLTEHDVATALFAQQPGQTNISKIMNTRLPFADIADSVEHCMHLMQQFHVRYVPVFENREFRGIISSDDILQEAIYSKPEIFSE